MLLNEIYIEECIGKSEFMKFGKRWMWSVWGVCRKFGNTVSLGKKVGRDLYLRVISILTLGEFGWG